MVEKSIFMKKKKAELESAECRRCLAPSINLICTDQIPEPKEVFPIPDACQSSPC